MTPRAYKDDRDWARMMALLADGRRANNGTYYVHTGDVCWWLFYPNQEADFAERIFLWEQGEQLVGWCLFTPVGSAYDLFIAPGLRGSPQAEAMTDWAEQRLASAVAALTGRRITTFWISEADSVRIESLQRRGFRPTEDALHYYTHDVADGPPPLPLGFTFRSVSDEADAQLRAQASRAAFGYKRPWDEYWARYQSFTRSRVYRGANDLMLVAPDGRCAAFCVCWPDDVNRVGLLEPVGTHPDFQGRGLGKALLAAALAHLRALGMQSAAVCADHDNPAANRLYKSAGFARADRLLLFEKELEVSA